MCSRKKWLKQIFFAVFGVTVALVRCLLKCLQHSNQINNLLENFVSTFQKACHFIIFARRIRNPRDSIYSLNSISPQRKSVFKVLGIKLQCRVLEWLSPKQSVVINKLCEAKWSPTAEASELARGTEREREMRSQGILWKIKAWEWNMWIDNDE